MEIAVDTDCIHDLDECPELAVHSVPEDCRGLAFRTHSQHGIYGVLGRLGFSVSYTSVLKLLRALSRSARQVVRAKALTRAFLLIYDNINRMARAWDPDLGRKDKMNNGTAATYIELEDCNVQEALNPEPLQKA